MGRIAGAIGALSGMLAIAAGALLLSAPAESQDDRYGPAPDPALGPALALAPGEYATTQELLDISVPGIGEAGIARLRSAFAEGAGEPYRFCVHPGDTVGRWVSKMVESDCTLTSLYDENGESHAELSCAPGGAIEGPVGLTGRTFDIGADLAAAFTRRLGRVPDAAIRMRVVAGRIGDCS